MKTECYQFLMNRIKTVHLSHMEKKTRPAWSETGLRSYLFSFDIRPFERSIRTDFMVDDSFNVRFT